MALAAKKNRPAWLWRKLPLIRLFTKKGETAYQQQMDVIDQHRDVIAKNKHSLITMMHERLNLFLTALPSTAEDGPLFNKFYQTVHDYLQAEFSDSAEVLAFKKQSEPDVVKKTFKFLAENMTEDVPGGDFATGCQLIIQQYNAEGPKGPGKWFDDLLAIETGYKRHKKIKEKDSDVNRFLIHCKAKLKLIAAAQGNPADVNTANAYYQQATLMAYEKMSADPKITDDQVTALKARVETLTKLGREIWARHIVKDAVDKKEDSSLKQQYRSFTPQAMLTVFCQEGGRKAELFEMHIRFTQRFDKSQLEGDLTKLLALEEVSSQQQKRANQYLETLLRVDDLGESFLSKDEKPAIVLLAKLFSGQLTKQDLGQPVKNKHVELTTEGYAALVDLKKQLPNLPWEAILNEHLPVLIHQIVDQLLEKMENKQETAEEVKQAKVYLKLLAAYCPQNQKKEEYDDLKIKAAAYFRLILKKEVGKEQEIAEGYRTDLEQRYPYVKLFSDSLADVHQWMQQYLQSYAGKSARYAWFFARFRQPFKLEDKTVFDPLEVFGRKLIDDLLEKQDGLAKVDNPLLRNEEREQDCVAFFEQILIIEPHQGLRDYFFEKLTVYIENKQRPWSQRGVAFIERFASQQQKEAYHLKGLTDYLEKYHRKEQQIKEFVDFLEGFGINKKNFVQLPENIAGLNQLVANFLAKNKLPADIKSAHVNAFGESQLLLLVDKFAPTQVVATRVHFLEQALRLSAHFAKINDDARAKREVKAFITILQTGGVTRDNIDGVATLNKFSGPLQKEINQVKQDPSRWSYRILELLRAFARSQQFGDYFLLGLDKVLASQDPKQVSIWIDAMDDLKLKTSEDNDFRLGKWRSAIQDKLDLVLKQQPCSAATYRMMAYLGDAVVSAKQYQLFWRKRIGEILSAEGEMDFWTDRFDQVDEKEICRKGFFPDKVKGFLGVSKIREDKELRKLVEAYIGGERLNPMANVLLDERELALVELLPTDQKVAFKAEDQVKEEQQRFEKLLDDGKSDEVASLLKEFRTKSMREPNRLIKQKYQRVSEFAQTQLLLYVSKLLCQLAGLKTGTNQQVNVSDKRLQAAKETLANTNVNKMLQCGEGETDDESVYQRLCAQQVERIMTEKAQALSSDEPLTKERITEVLATNRRDSLGFRGKLIPKKKHAEESHKEIAKEFKKENPNLSQLKSFLLTQELARLSALSNPALKKACGFPASADLLDENHTKRGYLAKSIQPLLDDSHKAALQSLLTLGKQINDGSEDSVSVAINVPRKVELESYWQGTLKQISKQKALISLIPLLKPIFKALAIKTPRISVSTSPSTPSSTVLPFLGGGESKRQSKRQKSTSPSATAKQPIQAEGSPAAAGPGGDDKSKRFTYQPRRFGNNS